MWGAHQHAVKLTWKLDVGDKTAEAGGRVIEFFPGQKLSKEQPEVKWDHNASDEIVEKVKAKQKAA